MKYRSQKFKTLIIATFVMMSLLAASPYAKAQDTAGPMPTSENDQSLKDIFDQDTTKNQDNRPKSGKEMAYEFYDKCKNSDDFFVSEKTQKNYCACKAAKMEETMNPKEMAALEEDSRAGKAARDKMRMNADANCMLDAIKSYTYGICKKDPHFREIIIGKASMCQCVRNYVARQAKKTMPRIILKAATQEPLSTNPLSFYLRDQDYNGYYGVGKEYCYNQLVYNQANK